MKNFVDIHKTKPRYEKIVNDIEELLSGKNKEIMKKYIEWHNYQIEQEHMAYSSSYRSLKHAMNLCDYFPDITKASQKKVEDWFSTEMNKEKVHRTSIGTLAPMGCKRSPETIEDISTQAIKFFKFVRFLDKGKPLHLFSSKRSPMPEVCEFIGIEIPKRKMYEKPRVTQEQIQELINYLRSDTTYRGELAGTLTALLNDTGMRFGEAVTLRLKDVVPEEDYLVITLRESKTRTRTVVSMLAKKYVKLWLTKHPDKNNPEALLFCNRFGDKVDYNNLRLVFNEALKNLNITWKEHSAYHYLRHLFASRATNFPDFHLKYWMGWSDRSMRAHYTTNTYKECLKYYKQMIVKENNPMIDESLSLIDSKEKIVENNAKQSLEAVWKMMTDSVGSAKAYDMLKQKVESNT